MSSEVSVVIPVKDGERYLDELLAALAAEGDLEVLVIDSGSRDRSRDIARSAGVSVLEIAPAQFGHGATRNLGAQRTSGELICFLTQDATPVAGWLDAYREAFSLEERVGAAYGPHLPRPGTSPMIARELEEFFAGFTPDGGPVVQRQGDASFLSNVNACYARSCWEEIGFRDVPYSEDQAFGREMLEAGWTKVFHPAAAVLHAHDYGALEFMRRYFDEYRGLRHAIDHVEPFGVRSSARDVARLVAGDRRWMGRRGIEGRARVSWTARSVVHHSGRKVFSALGSRAEQIPEPVQRALSLERRGGRGGAALASAPVEPTTGASPSALPPAELVARKLPHHEYEQIARVLAEGPVPLLDPFPGMADKERLSIAMIIPPFRRGSGGHNLLLQILWRLERMGHTCSVWHVDPLAHQREPAAVIRGGIREHFAPLSAPVFKGFEDWYGADVVLATSWITVYYALSLEHVRSRIYIVNDHEPEFYATSVESYFAQESYRFGTPVIAGSRWLRDLVTQRYGVRATDFEYGVDHDVYQPRPVERRRDTIAFYARLSTARRAVPLGILAMQILKQRRPDVRVVFFGDTISPWTAFDYENVGIVTPEQLSWLYSEATVGLCLSLTNYSLIPKEMLACGLPALDIGGASAESVFGAGGPVELAEVDPWAIADAVERLLDDEALWAARSRAGLEFVAQHTWDRATEQVEAGIRAALRECEKAAERVGEPPAEPDPATGSPVTDRLIAPLGEEGVAEVVTLLSEQDRAGWEAAPGISRRHLTLALGVHYRAPAVLEKTSLSTEEPPEDVHAMSRGSLAAGGAYYDADYVVDTLAALGVDPGPGQRWLDFGSSSGRIVRVLGAAYPETNWHACDPNYGAIAWASRHLPGIDFETSPQQPPLPYEEATFDVVYAVSIWSHFAQRAALRWLAEMRRILRPGGHLLLTTHGPSSVAFYARTGQRPAAQLREIALALHDYGFWYRPEFGEEGDHGVTSAEWGTAFLEPAWLRARAEPAWHMLACHPARNAGNQDVLVLQRR